MENLFSDMPARLLPWYRENRRDLPWRQDREPYHVWLSEIMLQQTRVEAVKRYYVRFLAMLPNIAALADADPELLNKLWEGLGYYTRVRNLQKAARQILDRHDGIFPAVYRDIRALAGIGDYTAGAIASICFEMPTPAVDGNVLRLCTRVAADPSVVDCPETRRAFTMALAEIYPPGQCGDFTQALMELGAVVCAPNGVPRCGCCPLNEICRAHRNGNEMAFPVRREKKQRRQEDMTVFMLECDNQWAIRKRPESGLLAGLWEFPHVSGTLEAGEALTQLEQWGLEPEEIVRSTEKIHIFTHIQWNMRGWYIRCANRAAGFRWAPPDQLDTVFTLPTAFRQFREKEE